jgi:predicted regulator of Ras-like GTPase activity (Roadblock/LC7/MglB family)
MTQSDLSWLLNNLVKGVAGVEKAILLSSDGLLMAASNGISRTDAEHLAAIASGCQSLARGATQQYSGGEVRQTIIEMSNAMLFVTPAGDRACLAVLGAADVDMGHIAYEMAVLVQRVPQHMSAHQRPPSQATAGA